MGSIRGYYEWDDDDLTPGRKKEGGLHQNLFDSDGSLKGNARFRPEADDNQVPVVVTDTVYVLLDERRQDEAAQERFEARLDLVIAILKSEAFQRSVAKIGSHAQHWWKGTARPALDGRRAKRLSSRSRRNASTEPATIDPAGTQLSEPAEEVGPTRPDMSIAEAKARYLAAVSAQAYSDEQMRLLANVNILHGDLETAKRSLAEIPSAQLRTLIEQMMTNPTLLTEVNLAQLASHLGTTPAPIAAPRNRP